MFCVFLSFSKIGKTKAAVLPVPLFAAPIKSEPFNSTGIVFVCISVGVSYPSSSNAFKISSHSIIEPNVLIVFPFTPILYSWYFFAL